MDDERPSTASNRTVELDLLREHQQAWEEFAVCAVRLIPVLKAQMTAVAEETERAAMDLMGHLRVLAASEVGAASDSQSSHVSKIVMAMQFQDITRQKLEHVGQALDQWSSHLQALMKGPQDADAKQRIAALQQIEQHYTMEEERRLHATAMTPDYQEPVLIDVEDSQSETDSITLF
jgi:hypothetical protein